MKHRRFVFICIILLAIFFTQTVVWSVSPTAEPTKVSSASASSAEKEVRQLREKIAQQVEEMKKDQKAYAGTITKKSDKQIELLEIDGINERKLKVNIDDTLTKLNKIVEGSKKEIKLADLVQNDYVIVLGQMMDNSIEADEVLLEEQFVIRAGKINEISKSDYHYKIGTFDKENYTLDIQNGTKQFMMNVKTKELERTGFSKVKEGDTIHFVVSKTNPGESKEKNRYDAVRIVIIPQEFFAQ